MLKLVISRAAEQFSATQKKAVQALKEKEKVRQERAEHVASLRALRLAKEAANEKAAEKAANQKAAEKAAAGKVAAKSKRPSRSPSSRPTP